MARWKARAEFLLSVIELLLPLRRYKAKRVKSRCFQDGVGQFDSPRPESTGEGVLPREYFWFLEN